MKKWLKEAEKERNLGISGRKKEKNGKSKNMRPGRKVFELKLHDWKTEMHELGGY